MDDLKPQAQRLYRSRRERMIAGVCGGLAQYFNVDPVIVRVAFVALGLSTGVGLLAYIVLAIVVPERPVDELEPFDVAPTSRGGSEILAYILVFVGAMALLSNLGVFNLIHGDFFWPFVLIGIGALLLIRRSQGLIESPPRELKASFRGAAGERYRKGDEGDGYHSRADL